MHTGNEPTANEVMGEGENEPRRGERTRIRAWGQWGTEVNAVHLWGLYR